MFTIEPLVVAKGGCEHAARTVVGYKNVSTIVGWSRTHSTVASLHVHGISSPEDPYAVLSCTLPSSITLPGVTWNSTTPGLVIVFVVPSLHPHGSTLLVGERVGDAVVGGSVGDVVGFLW
jgi:hypothetical protein